MTATQQLIDAPSQYEIDSFIAGYEDYCARIGVDPQEEFERQMATVAPVGTICACGSPKSRSHPRCRECYISFKANRGDIRAHATRRAEGRAYAQQLNAIFGLDDSGEGALMAQSDWSLDSRGERERAAASEHSGAAGDLFFSARSLAQPLVFTITDAEGTFEVRSETHLSTRVLRDMGLRRSYGKRLVRSATPLVNTTPAQPQAIVKNRPARLFKRSGRIGTFNRRVDLEGFVSDFDDQQYNSARAPVEFYIEADAALPNLSDSSIDDYAEGVSCSSDRISSRLTADPAEYDVAVRFVDSVAVVIPQTYVPRSVSSAARAWPIPQEDAWTEAHLEDELRRDWPQLFRGA